MKLEINKYGITLIITLLWLGILLISCNRQQSYTYRNGIYQPPPQEINDYEKP